MKRLTRVISIYIVLFILLFGSAFLYINSGTFIERCIVPLVAKALDTGIAVEKAKFCLFNNLELTNVRVGNPEKPFLTISTLRVSYKLFPMLKRRLLIDEIVIENPIIYFVETEDGQSNVALWITTRDFSWVEMAIAAIPKYVQIHRFQISNLSCYYQWKSRFTGKEMSIVVTEWNSSVHGLAPGNPIEFDSTANVGFSAGEQIHVKSNQCAVKLTGLLGRDYVPDSLNVILQVDQLRGNVGTIFLSDRALRCDIRLERQNDNRFQLKHCNLSECTNTDVKASLSLTGIFSMAPKYLDAKLGVRIEQSDLLFLICSVLGGYDLGETSINYQTTLLANEGRGVVVDGTLELNNFTLGLPGVKVSELRPVTISCSHEFSFDRNRKLLQLDVLNLVVKEDMRELMTLELDQPTSISLVQESYIPAAPTTLTLQVEEFEIDILSHFISYAFDVDLQGGFLNTRPNVKIIHTGRRLVLDGGMRLSNVDFTVAGTDYRNVNLEVVSQVIFDKSTSEITIQTFNIITELGTQPALDAKITGIIKSGSLFGALVMNQLIIYPPLMRLIPQIDISAYKFNKVVARGDLRIEFALKKYFSVHGTLCSDEVYFVNSESVLPPSFSFRLDIDTVYNLNSPVQLRDNILTVKDSFGEVASVTLNGTLDYGESSGKIYTKIDLGRLNHFFSGGVPFGLTGGQLLGSVELVFNEDAERVFGVGEVKLCNLVTTHTSTLGSATDADLELDVVYRIGGMMSTNRSRLRLMNQSDDTIAHIEITGETNVSSLEKASRLSIASLAPLNLNELMRHGVIPQLLGPSTAGTPAHDEKFAACERQAGDDGHDIHKENARSPISEKVALGNTKNLVVTKSLDSPFFLIMELNIPELQYEYFTVKDINTEISLSEKNLFITPSLCLINDGKVQFEAQCDFPLSWWKPICSGRLSLQDVKLPNMLSDDGGNSLETGGCIRYLDFDLTEAAWIDSDVFNQHLCAATYLELEDISFTDVCSKYSPVLDRLGLGVDHLVFDTLVTQFDIGKGTININTFDARNPSVRFFSAGSIELGGNWLPDTTGVLGYSGRLANVARDKNIKIKKADDGFFYTNSLPITWESWDKTQLLKGWIPKLVTKLFDMEQTAFAEIYGRTNVDDNWLRRPTDPDITTDVSDLIRNGVDNSVNSEPKPDSSTHNETQSKDTSKFPEKHY